MPTEAGGGVEALAAVQLAGDIGKTLIGAVGLLLVVVGWQTSVTMIGVLEPGGIAAGG
jgi:hypothetical protein